MQNNVTVDDLVCRRASQFQVDSPYLGSYIDSLKRRWLTDCPSYNDTETIGPMPGWGVPGTGNGIVMSNHLWLFLDLQLPGLGADWLTGAGSRPSQPIRGSRRNNWTSCGRGCPLLLQTIHIHCVGWRHKADCLLWGTAFYTELQTILLGPSLVESAN